MSAEDLADLARTLGSRSVRVVGGQKVHATCLMARWTHPGGRDEKPSMVMFPSGQDGDPIWKCHGCGQSDSVRNLILTHMVHGLSFDYAMDWICRIDGEPTAEGTDAKSRLRRAGARYGENEEPPKRKWDIKDHYVGVQRAAGSQVFYDAKCIAEADAVPEIDFREYAPYAGSVPKYAFERGLTKETCRVWELGHDKEHKRLLFPMRDHQGRLVAISGRLYAKECVSCGGRISRPDLGNEKKGRPQCEQCKRYEPPKYLHSQGFKRNLILYGESRIKIDNAPDRDIYVVEGHIDMIRMWQFGYRPVLAVLGSSPGDAQIEKLIRWSHQRIVLVPDGDKAGEEMAKKFEEKLAGRKVLIVRRMPPQMDPGYPTLTVDDLSRIIGPPTVNIDESVRLR